MTTNQLEPREASLATRVPDPEPERDRNLSTQSAVCSIRSSTGSS